MRYPIVIHKDSDSAYGVTVPDVPGCFSAGDTFEEAIANVTEAIECHLESLLMDEEDIPLPSETEIHLANPDFKDGVWALASVDLSKLSGKAKRINITIPERFLSQIDAAAQATGNTRSGFLTLAALEYMSKAS
ncbi:MAG: type II toxin-antitoxin system HicB family antitoxin [Cyanobacteria bacterium J06597_1]